LRKRTRDQAIRLRAAGHLPRSNQRYLDDVRSTLDAAGLGSEFEYRGELDRSAKLAFLRELDILSVPATYDEPKGMFLLEAMASGVPVVQPRRGSFTEIVERTHGGLLVAKDDPDALASGLEQVLRDHVLRQQLSVQAYEGVRTYYTVDRSIDRLLEAYAASI
jgi:glycosyltransferase involved in cell wall biosynthesis